MSVKKTSLACLFLGCFVVATIGCKKTTEPPAKRAEVRGKATSKPTGKKYADRMAKEHKRDKPVPAPAVKIEPKVPVDGKEVTYGKVGGKAIKGYLARPKGAKGRLPGLIVIHEWWGLNDNIRAMTRRLAGEGYVALAVDMYQGKSAKDPKGAKALMMASFKRKKALGLNIKAAHKYLSRKAKAKKIGSIGWCFGGGWSLQTGLLLGKKVGATVIYYGRVSSKKAELRKLKSPVLGIFGAKDKGIPVAGVRVFEKALKSLKKNATIVVYPEADHAFANPSGTRYRAKDAGDAWKRTMAFFKKHL